MDAHRRLSRNKPIRKTIKPAVRVTMFLVVVEVDVVVKVIVDPFSSVIGSVEVVHQGVVVVRGISPCPFTE